MDEVLLTDRLRNSVGLFHNVLFYMGDLHLAHSALNLSILDAGILIMFVDVLLVYVGLPYVLPLAVQLDFSLLDKHRGPF